jgi:hypothetical protein
VGGAKKLNVFHLKCRLQTVLENRDPINPCLAWGKIPVPDSPTLQGAGVCSFNATMMLEMLRGKRMLLVGDSLNREQYVPLLCRLHRAIPDSARSFETVDSLSSYAMMN